jgi:hypothetical protein
VARGRREVLQRLAATFGAGFVLPVLAEGHPMRGHLADHALVAAADAAGGLPTFLTAEQLSQLTAIAETIVPGSTKAAVAPFVDRLLAVDTPEHQQRFVAALDALTSGKDWSALTEPQRVEWLTAADPRHFQELKGWVVGGYYSSEIGMRELGWTGNMFYGDFPGCTHSNGHT